MGTYIIKVPDIGEGIAEAELVEWNVKIGDVVTEDQIIASVMTDKATVEIPAPSSGTVVWLNGEVGEQLAVGSEFVKLDVEGEGNAPAAAPAKAAPAEPQEQPQTAPEPAAPPAAATSGSKTGTYVIRLPDIGEGIAEAELAEWNVKIGDYVKEDEVLASVMTDKATVEIPASASGTVIWLGGEVGQQLAIGSDLVKLEVDGEGNVPAASEAPAVATAAAAPSAAAKAASPAPVSAPADDEDDKAEAAPPPRPVAKGTGGPVLAAPAVRARARDLGLDLSQIGGSGPEGRITHADLDSYLKRSIPKGSEKKPIEPLKTGSYNEIKVKGLRRKIAERMSLSKTRIPHITIVEEIDVTDLEDTRARLNASKGARGAKLTLLPFIMRAMSRALADYPALNAHYDDAVEVLRVYDNLHIGIATQTDNGLMVPVVRNCEGLGIWQLASELTEVTSAARTGKAAREVLSGSTITITSLGPLGAIATTPIINHPEVAIVGVNKMAVRPVWNGEAFIPRKMMNISCSFDHRVVDGWDAAVFVKRMKELLETPSVLFIKTRV